MNFAAKIYITEGKMKKIIGYLLLAFCSQSLFSMELVDTKQTSIKNIDQEELRKEIFKAFNDFLLERLNTYDAFKDQTDVKYGFEHEYKFLYLIAQKWIHTKKPEKDILTFLTKEFTKKPISKNSSFYYTLERHKLPEAQALSNALKAALAHQKKKKSNWLTKRFSSKTKSIAISEASPLVINAQNQNSTDISHEILKPAFLAEQLVLLAHHYMNCLPGLKKPSDRAGQ